MDSHSETTQNVLVVVAHPDDEVLGAGATIAQHANRGDDVRVVSFTDGVSARKSWRGGVQSKRRLEHAEKASAVLGFKWLARFDFPDNQLDSVPILELAQTLESSVFPVFSANRVYTHSVFDLNADHRRVLEATAIAFRPIPGRSPSDLISMEILSSSEYGNLGNGVFTPNFFQDASQTLRKKLEAIAAYEDELREFPHPRSIRGIENLALFRGQSVGLELAEAFQIIRKVEHLK